MVKLTTILLCVSMSASAQMIPQDKQKHFAAGVVLGTTGFGFKKNPVWGAVGTAALVGTMKEVGDIYKPNPTGFNVPDLLFTIAGGIVTGIIIKKIKKKRK